MRSSGVNSQFVTGVSTASNITDMHLDVTVKLFGMPLDKTDLREVLATTSLLQAKIQKPTLLRLRISMLNEINH